MEGLNWQTIQLALAAGMNQKADSRSLQPPELTQLIDAEFEKLGGLQTRKPWETATGALSIVGGGSIDAADLRSLVENGDELLLFTKTSLYSRNAQQAGWVLRGTHMAVKVDEQPRFVTTGDQLHCDRAELNGTIVYAWVDGATVYAAAIDKTTGSVLVAPTAVSGSSLRPRLVALSTKILLFTSTALAGFYVRAIDPASPSAGISGSSTQILSGPNCGNFYDVEKLPGSDVAVFVSETSAATYEVGRVTAGLAITQVTKARDAAGPVAIACTPDGAKLQVIRYAAASVNDGLLGDLLNASTLADINISTEITNSLTTTNINIAAAFSSVQVASEYVCHVFKDNEDSSSAFGVNSYTIDTAASVAAGALTKRAHGIASRAWDRDGSVFVNLVFNGLSVFAGGLSAVAARLQNTIFMYRHDGHLVGKMLVGRAAGTATDGSTAGYLPGVVSTATGVYSWCAIERRIVPLDASAQYADRGPCDVTIEFDTSEARRCVRLGETLYITGAEIRQYDGRRLTEVGFHWYPYYSSGAHTAAGGSVSAGTYAIKITYRWQNAKGEVERSTTATIGTITTVANDDIRISDIGTITATHKGDEPAIEVWRTLVDPNDDSPYYLATNNDPSDTSGANCYIANASTLSYVAGPFVDTLSDANLALRETNPENGIVLETLAPPPATIIAASQDRVFLAGISGQSDVVVYSRLRNAGEIASFHDTLSVAIPAAGGAITALVIAADGTPVVFRETAIYVLLGDGFDNAGNGQNYVARLASPDIGAVSQESVALGDAGVYFKSSKGWRVLNRAFQVGNIGDQVVDYNDEEPLAVVVMKEQSQVRVLTSSRMLVFDTLASEAMGRPTWAEWTIDDGVHACLWNGVHMYLSSSAGLKQQRSDYTGVDYGMDVETAWIKFNDLQGFARLRRLLILGEYRSNHTLRIRLARDYQTTYFQDKTWTVSPTTVGGPLQVKHGPSIQQMQAVKVRITATSDVSGEYATAGGLLAHEADTFLLLLTAPAVGTSYNGKTLELVADGTGAGSFTDGTAAVFHYESGVTTVNDLIVATALATYFRVSGSGTLNHAHTYTLAGGADASSASPSGEALKLTGLGLEVGFKRGLRPNLPSTQRQ